MATTVNPMHSIYAKLSNTGFKKSFVQSLLPEWWDDDIAKDPSGLQQASLVLGKLLSVRPETLWSEQIGIVLSIPLERKFKHRAGTNENALDIACAIAYSAARLALRAFKHEYRPELVVDAAQLRSQVISQNTWVGLAEILKYCTEIGIPVLYLNHFPSGTKKMDGLAFEVDGRPVIALTVSKKHGYLAFDLAHELGHIALGHVSGNKCVIDQKIDREPEDEDEKSANRFALELLTGTPDCTIVPTGRNLNGQELAAAALRYGTNNMVDPLHVALNYGYATRHWGSANIALSKLAGNQLDDQTLVNSKLFSNIDSEYLSDDDLVTLEKLSGFINR
jgi:Zn-dependent peptidase ImmA (M78 family)